LKAWQRNLYVIWFAEFMAIAGFSFVMPFLPYYIQDLGIRDMTQVELWSGVLYSAHAIPMAIFAPIWGMLADRYGRKPMVMRAMLGGAVVLGAMGFAQTVQQLLILRMIQGMLTGTVAAATTLVAGNTPRQRSGYALGMLQMAIFGGSSVGPLIGGVVADTWGYRATFWVTGTLLFLAGLTVWRFVQEEFTPPTPEERKREGGLQGQIGLAFRSPGLPAMFSISFLAKMATRIIGPILALFVQSLLPAGARVASMTGLISGAQAAAGAAGSVTLGRASDRLGYRRVLVVCASIGTLLFIPQFFVTTPWQLLVLQAILGFVMSGVLASISALMANLSPEGHQGAVYGVDASLVAGANAVGPMLGASVAAGMGLRWPFLVSALVLGLAAILSWTLTPSLGRSDSPPSASA
jgi:DHA1 family multidrug resistance protein-like MFS transporter